QTFVQNNDLIQSQLKELTPNAQLGALIAGIKKDVVITNRLGEKPNHVAIYGWHKLDGDPIQPLTIVHISPYVDYSHGIRLVSLFFRCFCRARTRRWWSRRTSSSTSAAALLHCMTRSSCRWSIRSRSRTRATWSRADQTLPPSRSFSRRSRPARIISIAICSK